MSPNRQFVALLSSVSTRWLDSCGVILVSVAANLLFSPQWPIMLNVLVVGCLGTAGILISHVAQESRDLIDQVKEDNRLKLEQAGRTKLKRDEFARELNKYLNNPDRRRLPHLALWALFALIAIPVAISTFWIWRP